VSVSNQGTGVPVGYTWKRLVFWDFPRASWQYDVVVALILAFIFLTPREWFQDQPKESSLVLLSSSHGADQVFVATELLINVPVDQRAARVHDLIRQRTGKFRKVVRVEPIRDDAAKELKGFIAYTTP
jgi:hypothetical protein